MEVKERVRDYRQGLVDRGYKTIEVHLTRDEVAILDALASQNSMSRVLFLSIELRGIIFRSGYFLRDGKLYQA